MDIQPAPQQDAPLAPEPTVSQAPSAEPTDTPLAATTEPSQNTPLAATPTQASTNSHKAPIGAIVAAIVIAVALAAVSVMAYQNNKDKQSATQQPAATQTQKEDVTASDVDQASKDVDQAMNQTDDTADLNPESLSDTTLGL